MLAEPVKQVSYVLQPRGKPLYEDESSFGMRMLTKMGWSKDKGLGAKEDGSKDFIRVKYKNSSSGMGFQDRDTQWTEHEDQFSKLLDNLKSETTEEDVRNCESLEEKSKKSRARVHYKKFTRGKDLSQYSEKDLANIFGRKTLKVEKVEEVETVDENPSTSVFGVNTTTSRMSSADYFRKKMNAMESPGQKKRHREEETEEAVAKKLKKRRKVPEKEKSQKKRKNLEEILPESEETEGKTQQDENLNKKKKKSNEKQKLLENQVSEGISVSLEEGTIPEKEKKSELFTETASEEKTPDSENVSVPKKKRKKNQEKILPEKQNIEETTKSKKKQKRVQKVIEVSSEEENIPETSQMPSISKELPVSSGETLPESVSEVKKGKKVRKNKETFRDLEEHNQELNDKNIPENVSEGKPPKKSKKKQKLFENPAILEELNSEKNPPENLSERPKAKKKSADKLSPEMEAALAEYSSSGEVIFKLPRNKCDLLLNFDSASLRGSNVHSVIGYRLSEQIDLDIIEGKRGASEPQSASLEPGSVENY